ncbi:MAG: amidohydrolase [Alphaproteobacteria bacterium]|nr:amidohydrolase [Alphaproteobacteria bacterium]|tara:strand:+ start:6929 stop:8602 length:1674 start_codon:yes stop_codon:yes gene_type:complete
MAYDLVIKNGTVVDGSGAPAQRADVAVADGKIVEIGKITDGAEEIVDASDCVVSPGFIDPHTHYDAQICWDGAVTPSSWHGVTSVVMGNCGVGIAPCLPESREIAMRDLVNVEGIPFDVLNTGITWDWETFPEFMDAAQARNPAVNLAFLAPLTPFRHYVMGEESMDRAATPEEIKKIAGLIGEAIDAGAFGFSTTILNQHVGYEGRPLACRNADDAELTAYARVLKARGKGTIEIAATKKLGVIDDDQYALLDMLLTESCRPVTFLGLVDRDDIPNAAQDTLEKTAPLLERGVRPQILPLPLTREFSMRNPFSFAAFPSWNQIFVDQSKEGQRAVYADSQFRNAFREELKDPVNFSDFNRIILHEVKNPELKKFEGHTVTEIAREQGKDDVDTLLDITLEDDVDNEFIFTSFNTKVDSMSRILNHPHVVIGLGDGGAHVDMLCDSGYPTHLLGTWVRDRQAMSLERAVQKLTSEPAELFCIEGRGQLKTGNHADITIFDPESVGSPERNDRSYDLPGGAKRMVRPSHGIEHTIVNGESVFKDGKLMEASSGRVLRS